MKVLALCCMILALGLAFVGVYFCLYSGIIGIINGFQASPISAGGLAWGIIRVLLTFPCSWGVALLGGFGFAGLLDLLK